jgi:hypothetical protein
MCSTLTGPRSILLTTMSKFLVLGMDIKSLVAAVTEAPARAFAGLRSARWLWVARATRPSSTLSRARFEFQDTQGERPRADRRLRPQGDGRRRHVVAASSAIAPAAAADARAAAADERADTASCDYAVVRIRAGPRPHLRADVVRERSRFASAPRLATLSRPSAMNDRSFDSITLSWRYRLRASRSVSLPSLWPRSIRAECAPRAR